MINRIFEYFKEKPLSEKKPECFSSYVLECKYMFNSEFNGKVKEFNCINFLIKKHFYFDSLSSFEFFDKYLKKYKEYEIVKIESNLNLDSINGVLKYVNKEKSFKKIFLIIEDYSVFYQSLGGVLVNAEFLPLFNNFDIQIGIIGKSTPMIERFLENKIEKSQSQFYLNGVPFDDYSHLFFEIKDKVYGKPLLKNDFYLYDDFQSENKKEIFEGDLIFCKNESFWNTHGDNSPFIPSFPHKRLDLNGRYDYYHVLFKDNEKMIVLNFISRKIGIIDCEKFKYFFKAKIRLGDKNEKR